MHRNPGLRCASAWAIDFRAFGAGMSASEAVRAQVEQLQVDDLAKLDTRRRGKVIGTFSEDDERVIGKDKLEFAEVRWMEISSVLQRESVNGTKPVKQIEFKGERLDLSSVRRWREKVLARTSS